MLIHAPTQQVQPILIPPKHDTDNLKTPTQQKIERETNIKNDKVKQIAQESVANVYKNLQKVVENTSYNVSYVLDDFGSSRQFRLTMKNSGDLIANIPPDVAVEIAERAKYMTKGLLMDFPA